VTWPAFAAADGANALALQFQLERSQRLSPEALLERQFGQLERLYAHACATVPYYAARWREWDVEPGRRLSLEAWRRLPVLRRRDVQEHGAELRSSRVPKQHGRTTETFTSGSTGTPVKVAATELTQFLWRGFTLRDHLWRERDLSGRLATIRTVKSGAAYPAGERAPTWGPATATAFETGPSAKLDIMTKTHLQAEWLARQNPDYLITYPSNLAALLEESPRRPPRLREVMTMSEALSPQIREACRAAWDVPVVDVYSTEELGYVALQCPSGEHYHVQAEGILVELLHESGRACEPGERGQVVATPLHNFAMPLLRYAVGDIAVAGGPCACGRGLPALERVLGRVRGMVRLPGGERHYPNYDGLMRGFDAIRQFQIVRPEESALDVRLVAGRALTEGELAMLGARIRERFQHPFALRFQYVDEIVRSPSGKYEDFRSELPEDQAY